MKQTDMAPTERGSEPGYLQEYASIITIVLFLTQTKHVTAHMDDHHGNQDQNDNICDMDEHSQCLCDDLHGKTLLDQETDEDGNKGIWNYRRRSLADLSVYYH